jgi:hypothetical protein
MGQALRRVGGGACCAPRRARRRAAPCRRTCWSRRRTGRTRARVRCCRRPPLGPQGAGARGGAVGRGGWGWGCRVGRARPAQLVGLAVAISSGGVRGPRSRRLDDQELDRCSPFHSAAPPRAPIRCPLERATAITAEPTTAGPTARRRRPRATPLRPAAPHAPHAPGPPAGAACSRRCARRVAARHRGSAPPPWLPPQQRQQQPRPPRRPRPPPPPPPLSLQRRRAARAAGCPCACGRTTTPPTSPRSSASASTCTAGPTTCRA